MRVRTMKDRGSSGFSLTHRFSTSSTFFSRPCFSMYLRTGEARQDSWPIHAPRPNAASATTLPAFGDPMLNSPIDVIETTLTPGRTSLREVQKTLDARCKCCGHEEDTSWVLCLVKSKYGDAPTAFGRPLWFAQWGHHEERSAAMGP